MSIAPKSSDFLTKDQSSSFANAISNNSFTDFPAKILASDESSDDDAHTLANLMPVTIPQSSSFLQDYTELAPPAEQRAYQHGPSMMGKGGIGSPLDGESSSSVKGEVMASGPGGSLPNPAINSGANGTRSTLATSSASSAPPSSGRRPVRLPIRPQFSVARLSPTNRIPHAHTLNGGQLMMGEQGGFVLPAAQPNARGLDFRGFTPPPPGFFGFIPSTSASSQGAYVTAPPTALGQNRLQQGLVRHSSGAAALPHEDHGYYAAAREAATSEDDSDCEIVAIVSPTKDMDDDVIWISPQEASVRSSKPKNNERRMERIAEGREERMEEGGGERDEEGRGGEREEVARPTIVDLADTKEEDKEEVIDDDAIQMASMDDGPSTSTTSNRRSAHGTSLGEMGFTRRSIRIHTSSSRRASEEMMIDVKNVPLLPMMGANKRGRGRPAKVKQEPGDGAAALRLVKTEPSDVKPVIKRRVKKPTEPILMKKEYDATHKILDEVLKRGHQTPEQLDAQYQRDYERGVTEYPVQYIVGTDGRTWDGKYYNLIVKVKNYAVSNWTNGTKEIYVSAEYADFFLFQRFCDQIKHRLVDEIGPREFARRYPHRFLKHEEGAGRGCYVTHRRSLYYNRLKAIQWQWNVILQAAGRPPIIIEDWTDLLELDDLLKAFQFIVDMEPDKEVQALMKKYLLAADIKCVGEECKAGCLHANTVKARRICCGLAQNILHDPKTDKATYKLPTRKQTRYGDGMQFECLDTCHEEAEARENCENRAVQRGRLQPMVVFRDFQKGWTLRTPVELKRGAFVGNYAGVVSTKTSPDGSRGHDYDFPMQYGLRTENGKMMKPLNVCAYKKGNETRFASHACEPNCSVVGVVVERHGRWYAHHTFRADVFIPAGSEICFNYFVNDEEGTQDVSQMFPYCFCESPICRYTEEKMKVIKKKKMEEEKRKKAEKRAKGRKKSVKNVKKDEEEGESGKEESLPSSATDRAAESMGKGYGRRGKVSSEQTGEKENEEPRPKRRRLSTETKSGGSRKKTSSGRTEENRRDEAELSDAISDEF